MSEFRTVRHSGKIYARKEYSKRLIFSSIARTDSPLSIAVELAMLRIRPCSVPSLSRNCGFVRDKTSLDVFWLKDKSLVDPDNLPEPDELAEQTIENLEAGLDSFWEVLARPR